MKFEIWYLLLGGLLLVIAILDKYVKRLPITTAILYLGAGISLGPLGFGVLEVDPIHHSWFLERATELAVIISLFTAGLKLRTPFAGAKWQLPTSLAFLGMIITVGLIALVGVYLLKLSWGVALLLGAVLAPTDPVLASDVQLGHPGDRDRVRFGLTGEAGLNDGTAFPFVMLGLGLLGLHDLGTNGIRWLLVDLLWAIVGGLGIGGISGWLVGKLVVQMRKQGEETLGRDEFIALGLIGFSYGAAILIHAYGFLAVFAAGLAFRHTEGPIDEADLDQPKHDRKFMTLSVLSANEQLERIVEVGLVLFVGAMLSQDYFSMEVIWVAALLFFIIRPVAVAVSTIGSKASGLQRMLFSWFGIRGIGSLYYLMYALQHGVTGDAARQLSSLVLCIMAVSIVVHGISVTPIMNAYEKRKR